MSHLLTCTKFRSSHVIMIALIVSTIYETHIHQRRLRAHTMVTRYDTDNLIV